MSRDRSSRDARDRPEKEFGEIWSSRKRLQVQANEKPAEPLLTATGGMIG
jgi:hypothetical protein